MARRNNNTSGGGIFLLLLVFGAIVYFIAKWTIIIAVAIIVCSIKFITWFVKLIDKKRNKNNITKKPFKNAKLNTNESLMPSIQLEKKKLGVFDKNVYDEIFSIQIRNRGELYYYDNRIKDYKENENMYSCLVSGTEDYKVSITLDEDDMLVNSSCTCPYYTEKNKNCKHIYALLYKVKCSENKDKILTEIEYQISGIKTMLKNAKDYLERNKSHFSDAAINIFNKYSEQYSKQLVSIENSITEIKLEDSLLNKLESLLDISFELKQKVRKTLSRESTRSKYIQTTSNYSYENTGDLSDTITEISIASMIDSHINNQKDSYYNEKLEKEMDNYGLEEWQRDLVRKGEYDPWNFEEDGDFTEDDYYYEDN